METMWKSRAVSARDRSMASAQAIDGQVGSIWGEDAITETQPQPQPEEPYQLPGTQPVRSLTRCGIREDGRAYGWYWLGPGLLPARMKFKTMIGPANGTNAMTSHAALAGSRRGAVPAGSATPPTRT